MAHVRKVCSILEGREKQLEVCVHRQANQDVGLWSPSSLDEAFVLRQQKSAVIEENGAGTENQEASNRSSNSKFKPKGKGSSKDKSAKDKDHENICGFDFSLVWDDMQDMQRMERAAAAALQSVVTSPSGSRSSSMAPPSSGVVVVVSPSTKKFHNPSEDKLSVDSKRQPSSSSSSVLPSYLLLQLEDIGREVCLVRRHCDRHNGWQKLKSSELDLEKTLQVMWRGMDC